METFLSSIKKYFEANGLCVEYDCSDRGSDSYIILKGGTSVNIKKKCRDGVDGIIFYCAKDKKDRDNIVHELNKIVYSNSQEARPYKIQIFPEEMDSVVELLKMNDKNLK